MHFGQQCQACGFCRIEADRQPPVLPDRPRSAAASSRGALSVDYRTSGFADPEIVTLNQNYRAAPELVATSNSLASHFIERRHKDLEAVSTNTGEIHIHGNEDALHEGVKIANILKQQNKHGIPFSEMAVLARTNALPSALVGTLLLKGVPVALRNGVEAFANPHAKQLVTALVIASLQKLAYPKNTLR